MITLDELQQLRERYSAPAAPSEFRKYSREWWEQKERPTTPQPDPQVIKLIEAYEARMHE